MQIYSGFVLSEDLVPQLIEGVGRPRGENDGRALTGQSLRVRLTEPRADTGNDVRVLGPAEAPLALVRGRYRFRLLVKGPRAFDLSGRVDISNP